MYSIVLAKIIGDGGLVHAVDLWAEGMERLRERIERQRVKNISPIVADVSKTLPLPGEGMDLVLMATVLHDLKEAGVQDGALAEARRLLKRHGTLAVVEFEKVPGPPGPRFRSGSPPRMRAPWFCLSGSRKQDLHEIGPCNYLITFGPKRGKHKK